MVIGRSYLYEISVNLFFLYPWKIYFHFFPNKLFWKSLDMSIWLSGVIFLRILPRYEFLFSFFWRKILTKASQIYTGLWTPIHCCLVIDILMIYSKKIKHVENGRKKIFLLLALLPLSSPLASALTQRFAITVAARHLLAGGGTPYTSSSLLFITNVIGTCLMLTQNVLPLQNFRYCHAQYPYQVVFVTSEWLLSFYLSFFIMLTSKTNKINT